MKSIRFLVFGIACAFAAPAAGREALADHLALAIVFAPTAAWLDRTTPDPGAIARGLMRLVAPAQA